MSGTAANKAMETTTWRVLLIDDEVLVLRSLRRTLRRAGFTSVGVSSGEEALVLLDSGVRFDVIVSDVMMPGMDGIELHERVVALSQQQAERVVFITGDLEHRRTQAFLAGVDNRVLEKPFRPQELLEAVREVCLSSKMRTSR